MRGLSSAQRGNNSHEDVLNLESVVTQSLRYAAFTTMSKSKKKKRDSFRPFFLNTYFCFLLAAAIYMFFP